MIENLIKQHKVAVVCIILLVLWLGALFWFYKPCCWFKQNSASRGYEGIKEVIAQNGTVQIPISEINDGTIHFYKYNASNVWTRFFVVKAQSGNIKTAFDACEACGPAGYDQSGNELVCKKCGLKFNIEDIGTVVGGCNPIPLNATLSASDVIISVNDIENGRQYFD